MFVFYIIMNDSRMKTKSFDVFINFHVCIFIV